MKQNARSLFWIEPPVIAALLEQVDAEPTPAEPTPAEPTPAEPTPAEPPPAAPPSTQDEDDETLPVWPMPALPDGSLESRLAALFAWLGDVAGYEQAFVADSEGLAMADDNAPAELVAAAAMLGATWVSMQTSQSLPAGLSMAVDLAGDQRLYLLLAKSPWGRMNLGFVTRHPLPAVTLSQVGEAFQKTVGETPTGRVDQVDEKEQNNP